MKVKRHVLLCVLLGITLAQSIAMAHTFDRPLTDYIREDCVTVGGIYNRVLHCQTADRLYLYARPTRSDLYKNIGKGLWAYTEIHKPITLVVIVESPADCALVDAVCRALGWTYGGERLFTIATTGKGCQP